MLVSKNSLKISFSFFIPEFSQDIYYETELLVGIGKFQYFAPEDSKVIGVINCFYDVPVENEKINNNTKCLCNEWSKISKLNYYYTGNEDIAIHK